MNRFATVPDAVLRPWMKDSLQESLLLKEENALESTLHFTSAFKQAGFRGNNSDIDVLPEEVRAFEAMVGNPLNWCSNEAMESETEARTMEDKEKEVALEASHVTEEEGVIEDEDGGHDEDAEEDLKARRSKAVEIERIVARLKLSSTASSASFQQPPLRFESKLPSGKRRKKKKVRAVPYFPLPGPATINMSTQKFLTLLQQIEVLHLQ